MNPVTHIIERQVLDLTLDTDHEAQARQEAARRVLRDQVQPMLDEVFTRLAGPDRVLRLDRLDLDLGTLPAENWTEQLVERLREQVEQELRQHVRAALYGNTDAASKKVAQSQLDAFMIFIDTGSLPWWVPDSVSFDPGAVLVDLIASQPEALRTALRSRYRPERARRLVFQIHSDVFEQLHTLLAPAATTLIQQVQRAWQRLGEADLSAAGEKPLGKTQVETAVLDLLLDSSTSFTLTEKQLHEAIGRQMTKQGGSVKRLERAIALLPEAKVAALEASEAGPLVAWLRETTPKSGTSQAAYDEETAEANTKDDHRASDKATASAQPEPSAAQQQAESDDTSPEEDTASAAEHESEEVQHFSPASDANTVEPDETEALTARQEARGEADKERFPDQEPFESVESSSLEGQAFYVTNAGLVLLWPFLGRFFKKMDLVADKAFRTAALQQRAVLLTHFLVTGETEAPEQVLLLNKILCGWPPDATVPKSIDLTTEERDESQVLLEAAVTQWAALKNTSIAGLQQAFLQREGRLLKQPDAWTLKVDRTGYDMLLDRLPWSIAIIKQPWMPHPLFVEW